MQAIWLAASVHGMTVVRTFATPANVQSRIATARQKSARACRVVIGSLVLAGASSCATMPRSHPAFVFEGSEENLIQLVQAAQGCGLADAAITREIPGGPLVVLIDIPARTDPRFDCTMRWIGDHPEAGFFQDR